MNTETTIEVIDVKNLSDKTMFISLEFNRFGNSKKANVEAKTDANQERFSHSKRLLNSPELAAVVKADNALQVWLDAPTRCWKYSRSMRLVPHDLVESIFTTCKQYQDITRPSLVKKFVDAYLAQIAEAKNELGTEFNISDYPAVDKVEQEFNFKFQFLTFGTPDHLKTISPAMYQAETEKASKFLMDAAFEVRDGMRAVFQDMVTHLMDILTPDAEGKKKRLRTTTVVKLQDFLNTFELRNVTNDEALQSEVSKLKQLMEGIDADKLRESDNLQADLIVKFGEVSKNMEGLVQVTGRKFR